MAALVILDLSVSSDPPGAQVFRRPYVSTDAEWELLGITPLEGVSVPTGPSRIKLEMEGFRPYYTGAAPSISARLTPETTPSTTVEMVRVPRGIAVPSLQITGLGHLLAQSVDEFDFGRVEVTNEQFKEFVDAGGYERRGLWATELARDGRTIPWEEAVRQFVDRSGRLGPATWALGTYPSGQGRFPVSGVSWYEADAYARFSGLQLPTIYHWMLAAWPHRGHLILPFSNVEGTSQVPVGELDGMSMSGAFDVAGNVREWTANAMEDQRIILGGSFEDPSYMFSNMNHLDAFDRSAGNGIRVADYAADPNQEILSGSVERQRRDFATERPASDDVFAIYSGLYEYDEAPLAATVESRDSTPDWIRESVTFEGPDGDERVVAHLFLPPEGPSPYQTLVYFPGAAVLNANSLSGTNYHQYIQGFTRTGRAVLLPAYKGTLERRPGAEVASWYPNPTTAYRDWVITMGRELKRSVDYLESRPELIDASKLAFFGNSWGGSLSGVMMAIEPRFKAGVLQCPGLTFVRMLPEVDPLHFLPRITIPVLMVDGQHDAIFPVETSQVPMYELLGTPEGRKRHVVVDAAHCPARTFFHAEALDWLDQHLGPVR